MLEKFARVHQLRWMRNPINIYQIKQGGLSDVICVVYTFMIEHHRRRRCMCTRIACGTCFNAVLIDEH